MAATWNSVYTQLIRRNRPTHWGNWSLDRSIQPGAVGTLDPGTGQFTPLGAVMPNVRVTSRPASQTWSESSEGVSRSEGKVNLDGSGVDPESGTEITAGIEVAWKFGERGSMVSEFSVIREDEVENPGRQLVDNMDWLAARAAEASMGDGRSITQGFGMVTGVVLADGGLNIAAEEADTTFSITGSVEGVNKMLDAEVKGSGSYVHTTSNKTVNKHIWPDRENVVARDPAPIAFTFATVIGTTPVLSWVTSLSSLRLVLDNSHGGTYVVDGKANYTTSNGQIEQSTRAPAGLSASFDGIPLTATKVHLRVSFNGVLDDDEYDLEWNSPVAQWRGGVRHVDLFGVWPGGTSAVDREGSLG